MNRILVPIDFSKASEKALVYAVMLGNELESTVVLLHAYHTVPAHPELRSKKQEEELNELRTSATQRLEELKREVVEPCMLDCELIVEEGSAKDLILLHANKPETDLLVMGTEEIMPVDRILFGTITGKVLKKVRCPIAIVPEEAEHIVPSQIAYATDYHDNDLENVQFLHTLSKRFESHLMVVRVASIEAGFATEDKLMKDFAGKVNQLIPENSISWQLLDGNNVNKELTKLSSDAKVDLLAASRTDLSVMTRFLFGSVTQKLFYNTHIPLLIFHAADSDLREDKMAKRERYE